MFEKEAIEHAFEATIGIECLNKPVEDFTYEELSDEQQEKVYDFKQGAEFGYNKANEELEEKIKVKKLEILELKSQIKKMKCDVIFLIKDRMNDDIDQNIIERLAEKWEIKEND